MSVQQSAERAPHAHRFRLWVVCAWLALALGLTAAALLVLRTVQFAEPQPAEPSPLRRETHEAARQTFFCTQSAPAHPGSPWLLLVNKENPIPADYVLALVPVGENSQLQAAPAAALEQMLADGRAEGLDLFIRSAYRSNAEQTTNFNSKKATYLAQGFDEQTAYEYTSASIMVPGCSEHETGLCSDIATSTTGELNGTFAETPEGVWLAAHCAEYGFILRYPEGRQDVTGVYYEPWHFRYVGTEDAEKITQGGLTLEEYLANGNAFCVPKHFMKENYEQN